MNDESADVPYVIRKGGMFYAYNDCGYVSRVEVAELYTRRHAMLQAEQCEDISVYPVTDFISDVGHIDNVIDHLTAMRDAAISFRESKRG